MSKHDEIIRSEKIIRDLLAELEGLKSSREVLEDANERTLSMKRVSEALVQEVGRLTQDAQEILTALGSLNLDVRLQDFTATFDRSGEHLRRDLNRTLEETIDSRKRFEEHLGNVGDKLGSLATVLPQSVETIGRSLNEEVSKAAERGVSETQRLSSDIGQKFTEQSANMGEVRAEIAAALDRHFTAIETRLNQESTRACFQNPRNYGASDLIEERA